VIGPNIFQLGCDWWVQSPVAATSRNWLCDVGGVGVGEVRAIEFELSEWEPEKTVKSKIWN